MENGSGANYVGNLKGEEKIIGSANVGAMYHPGLSAPAKAFACVTLTSTEQLFIGPLLR